MSNVANYVVQAAQDALNDLMGLSGWDARITSALNRFERVRLSHSHEMPVEVLDALNELHATNNDASAWKHGEEGAGFSPICGQINAVIQRIFTADGAGKFDHGNS